MIFFKHLLIKVIIDHWILKHRTHISAYSSSIQFFIHKLNLHTNNGDHPSSFIAYSFYQTQFFSVNVLNYLRITINYALSTRGDCERLIWWLNSMDAVAVERLKCIKAADTNRIFEVSIKRIHVVFPINLHALHFRQCSSNSFTTVSCIFFPFLWR